MFKIVTSILLAASLAFPWGAKVFVTLDYAINKDYIAANLCENKEQPELHCEGKCVLMQKLNISTQEDSPLSKSTTEILQFDVSSFVLSKYDLKLKELFSIDLTPSYIPNHRFFDSRFISEIFHPPRLR